MTVSVLAFLAGAALVLGLAELPSGAVLAACLAAALAAWRARAFAACAFACGFVVAACHGHAALARDWPCSRDREVVPLSGVVQAPPQRWSARLDVELAVSRADQARGLPPRVRLSWYEPGAQPGPGERWAFTARLRCRSGLANPGARDRELSLLRAGLGATGYVAAGHEPRRLEEAGWRAPVQRMRAAVAARIEAAAGDGASAGVLQGLAVGLRAGIPDELEDAFAATGTAHLIAISGMHVTAFALALLWVSRALWAVAGSPRLSAAWPALQACGVLALTGGYALLAGASVPTLRTAAMVAVALLLRLARRALGPAEVLAAAAFLLVAADPLAATSAGFWLSFVAVAALLATADAAGGPWRALRGFAVAQAVVTVALTPVLLAAFNAVPLVSPLANALAVPLFTLLLLPLTLLGLALTATWPSAAEALWRQLASALDAGWPALIALGAQPWSVLHPPAPPAWLVVAALGMALAAVLFPVRALRVAAAVGLAALLLRAPPSLPEGSFELTVLDVGQGLAAVVSTARHVLVYDTGPAWRGGGAAAEHSLLPWLRARGVDEVQVAVVSHADVDHAGGLEVLRTAVPVGRILGPEELPGAVRCVAGEAWTWDGVAFEVLHPGRDEQWSDNDGSCTLRVAAGGQAALLLADTGRRAEQAMSTAALAAEVVLVPHHGSHSSSGEAFVAAVAPRLAVVSTGFGNRFGLPREEVLRRWRDAGATVLDTAFAGAVTARVGDGELAVRVERACRPRWWRRRAGAGGDADRLSCRPHVGDHPGWRPGHVADPALFRRSGSDHPRAPLDAPGEARDPARADRPRLEAGRDAHPHRPPHRGARA